MQNRQRNRKPAHNSTYKKLAVQWLNEALCFVSSFVVADSFVLRNRQLLVAAKRCSAFNPRQLSYDKKTFNLRTVYLDQLRTDGLPKGHQ